MLITISDIHANTESMNTFRKGAKLFAQNRIEKCEIKGNEIIGLVNGETDDYNVTILLDKNGTINEYNCECVAFSEYPGLCKHLVAVALQIESKKDDANKASAPRSKKVMDSVQKGREVFKKPGSDPIVQEMIHHLISVGTRRVEARFSPSEVEEPVRLTPILYLEYTSLPQLSLTIGRQRQYSVPSIEQFVSNSRLYEPLAYGKQFVFNHDMSKYDLQSRMLAELVLRAYSTYTRDYNSRKRMYLSPIFVDHFFDLYMDAELAVSEKNEKPVPMRICDKTIRVPVQIDRSDSGITLSCQPDIRFVEGRKHIYIVNAQEIRRCEEDFSMLYTTMLKTMIRNKGGLFVDQKDMTMFLSLVMPMLSKYADVTGDIDCLNEYMPHKYVAEVYLDAPHRTELTARLKLRYETEEGTVVVEFGDESAPVKSSAHGNRTKKAVDEIKPRRNAEAEIDSFVTLRTLFDDFDEERELFYLETDDDGLYTFLNEKLPKLYDQYEVYMSDAFKNTSIVRPKKNSVGVSIKSDLLEIDFSGIDMDTSELYEILQSYRKNKRYHRLTNGGFVELMGGVYASMAALADGLDLGKDELAAGSITVPKHRALLVDNLLRNNEDIDFERDRHFRELVRNMRTAEDTDFSLPDSLEHVLRGYQKTGFRWLRTLEQYGFAGILADDMGLGKTLQVIALLLGAKESGNTLPSLICCPASLVLNWEAEIKKFAPQLNAVTVIGTAAEREKQLAQAEDCDVLVTSYDLLKRDTKLYEKRSFYYMVIDEAQFIKNRNTKAAQGVKTVPSKYRCALTGTPIENRLSELWSIFDFLMPGYLHTYTRFKERFEVPAIKDGDAVALSLLNKMVAPFILRRLKTEVLKELPEKTETVIYSALGDEQGKLYKANAALAKEKIASSDFSKEQIAILAILTRLRQICCDPMLCYENYTEESGKLQACIELLREAVDGGHKVLLFSQFTSMLDIIAKRLTLEGISFYTLEGKTKKEERKRLVDAFNADRTEVFLISLKAGGTGLNLTSADVVIHFDPWWNVAAQNQATDRAHRIGQEKPVTVYKLVAKDTIEERIIALQEAKRDLADAVIKEGEGILSTITKDELLGMFE